MKGLINKEFAGKARGFAFNMYTWELISEMSGKPINEFLGSLSSGSEAMSAESLKSVRFLIYCGLKSYADINGEVLDINQFQVGAEIGESPDLVASIISAMAESMSADNGKENPPSKKKLNSVK